MDRIKFYRSMQLILGLLLMLFSGLLFAWSVFVAPIESEFGWDRAQTSMVFTVSMSVSVVGGMFSGYFTAKKSVRFSLLVAAGLVFVGFLGAVKITTLFGLYLFYGVFSGFGVGVCYNCVLTAVVFWFPQKAGTVTGSLLMAFGLGGLVLGSGATSMINLWGWRTAFLIIGMIYFALLVLAAIVMRIPAAPVAASPATGSVSQQAVPDVPPREMVRQLPYQLFVLWVIITGGAGLMIIGHAAPAAIDIGATSAAAGFVAGVVSIFNGFSRLVWGHLLDRVGPRFTHLLIGLFLIAGALLSILAFTSGSILLLAAGFSLVGAVYGGTSIAQNHFIRAQYGMKYLGFNYALTNLSTIASSLLGPMVAGMMQTAYHSYVPSFLALLAFGTVACVLTALIFRKSKVDA
ncbi:MFS transporter [Hydrogenoanaerobacterium sp.]|uniref:MFS transporter n=1 Tax=Hydrogenoanaerobacterium sp. TaxID=2953763 RepID=UPI0028973375|nr:MFS transporter [Hydrogenoanaerobacterium sp.]